MKRYLLFVLICFASVFQRVSAQEMDAEGLRAVILQEADTVSNKGNTIQFTYREKLLICIYDEAANRMRIIAPIIKRKELEEEQLLNALVANFHSALDVRYALSDEIIWSVYTHPLKSLQPAQLKDAIQQVHQAAITFGTTYNSTSFVFPGNTRKEEKLEPGLKLQKS